MIQEDLVQRVERLEIRNYRVEGDKAWETSWTRRLGVTLMTYMVVAFYLEFMVHINPPRVQTVVATRC